MSFPLRRAVTGWALTVALIGTTAVVPGAFGASASEPSASEPSEDPVEAAGPEAAALLEQLDSSGEAPTQAQTKQALGDTLEDPLLGHVALDVRDAVTGDVLFSQDTDHPHRLASMTKLVTSAAIVNSGWDLDQRLKTRVVLDEDNNLVIVAGGDTMLGTGRGDPAMVSEHAGLQDLAEQTAAAVQEMRASGAELPESFTVKLDDSAAGPSYSDGWSDVALNEGWTGRVVMLGLEDDRAAHRDPTSLDPAMTAAGTFAGELAEQGMEINDAIPKAEAPVKGEEIAVVQSAPLRDQLIQALTVSDNAVVETLARQAAIATGGLTDGQAAPEDVGKWVIQETADREIDTAGMQLHDASGLNGENRIPVHVVGELLQAGAGGDDPDYERLLANLSLAALTGTLEQRFLDEESRPARGKVRGKTGTLPQASGMSGVVVSADGRLMTFSVSSDGFSQGVEAMLARPAHDHVVAALADCADCAQE